MMPPPPQRHFFRTRGKSANGDEDRLTPKKVFTALSSLPRVLRLVWRISPIFTALLGVLYIVQGFLPAAPGFGRVNMDDGKRSQKNDCSTSAPNAASTRAVIR